MNDSLDDAALLAALRAAVAARAAVPAAFAEAGRNAYAWHGIDAELASISYDSLLDAGQTSGVRSESASIRALTFESARFSIGVEITDDALFGQLVPPQPGTAELESRSGQIVAVPIDDVGCFTFGQRPDGPFRLRCHNDAQADVRTGWVTLLAPGGTTPRGPQVWGVPPPYPPSPGRSPGTAPAVPRMFPVVAVLGPLLCPWMLGIALPGRPRHQSGVVPPMIAACTSVLACQ